MTAESDAHMYFEIGRGRTIVNSEVKRELKKGKVEIEKGKESCYYLVHGLSVAIEKIKEVMGR